MLMRDVLNTRIEMNDVRLISLNTSIDNPDCSEDMHILGESNFESKVIDLTKGIVQLKVVVKVESCGLYCECVHEGMFTLQEEELTDQFGKFLEFSAIRFLWPYSRATIQDITGKMIDQPIIIPTLDMTKHEYNKGEE